MNFSSAVNLSVDQSGLRLDADGDMAQKFPLSAGLEGGQHKAENLDFSKFIDRASKKEQDTAPTKKDVQTTSGAAASTQQKTSEIKTGAKGEAVYGGMNEDLFIEAKKKDTLYAIKEKTSGDLGGIRDDEEKDSEDHRKKKHDFDFLSDIMALLYRLGVIKKKTEK
ncbi:MAG: hypothetical protein AABZ57_05715 [Candidatus Margulisiibacteriota bacterium]